VTLGALAEGRADPLKNTAPHLTPAQFHEELQRAAHTQSSNSTTTVDGNSSSPQSTSDTDRKEVVLLDARNAYETTIGHFKAVRQSDGPAAPLLLR
jgi:predicted sulfurtransferase